MWRYLCVTMAERCWVCQFMLQRFELEQKWVCHRDKAVVGGLRAPLKLFLTQIRSHPSGYAPLWLGILSEHDNCVLFLRCYHANQL